MKILQGKTIGAGIAVGKILKITANAELQESFSQNTAAEEKRLQNGIARLQTAITQEMSIADKTARDILEAQKNILEDNRYQQAILHAIYTHNYTAEYAAISCGKALASEISALENEYLRTRADDVYQIASRLADTILGKNSALMIEEPVILAAEEFTPAQLAMLDKNMLLGIVAHKGSPASHTAILATNYGLPYLTGIDLTQVSNSTMAVIDGENSQLILEPDTEKIVWANQKIEEEKARLVNTPVSTRMKVCCNISSLKDLDSALEQNADGIGLFRTEFLFMNRETAPDEAEQFETYRTVLKKMGGKEVIIRTIDVGTDKPVHYLKLPKEENPQLGLRGIRVSLKYPQIFREQLRALLQAANYGNLGIMFPMITSAKEILSIKEQVKLAEDELKNQGKTYKIPKLGIMIETPAAALVSDELAELVEFFSIGTNDLTQYTLALDRQSNELEYYYEPRHEAIFKLIETTVQNAHAHGITVSICGEIGANEKALPRLAEIGVDEVSVGAAVISKTRCIIADCKGCGTTTASAPEADDTASLSLSAPVDGRLINMAEIPDETFAKGIMGPCFAIEPDSGDICAPASGTIENIAATKHAIVLRDSCNNKILIHVGIDTVKLEGKPFTVMVKEGQKVIKGNLLIRADLAQIKEAGCSVITPVVLLRE